MQVWDAMARWKQHDCGWIASSKRDTQARKDAHIKLIVLELVALDEAFPICFGNRPVHRAVCLLEPETSISHQHITPVVASKRRSLIASFHIIHAYTAWPSNTTFYIIMAYSTTITVRKHDIGMMLLY